MNENFNYTINKLRVDFEELEKRIKSIEKSVSGIRWLTEPWLLIFHGMYRQEVIRKCMTG